MKKHFLSLLIFFCWLFSSGLAFATNYPFPCPASLPSPRDSREVFVGFEYNSTPIIGSLSVDICNNVSLHNEVHFKFPDFTAMANAGHEVTFQYGDGTLPIPVLPGQTLVHFYPVNQTGDFVSYLITMVVDDQEVATTQIIINSNNTVAPSGAFIPPQQTVHFPLQPLTVEPPIADAFPAGSIYNGNTVGGADVYIQYAPAHNGKLLKPLIFVDGIDFNATEYTWNGQVVRHGSTGWDIFTMGNDNGSPNSFDNQASIFAQYPEALQKMGEDPNNYDILFVDFERGSDWIQKNGEILIDVIKWVNRVKDSNREAGYCVFDNVVIGASMGGQVAKWALRTMELRNLDHETHTYVSFDSPQKGAHIPLGVQSFALLADRAGIDGSSPTMWSRLNSPAARQMLLQHLTEEFSAGRVSIFQYADAACDGPFQVPETVVMEFTQTGQIRDQFKNEMEEIGYPASTYRNIAISCGSGDKTDQGFGSGDRLLSAAIALPDIDCGSGEEFALDAQIFSPGGGTGADKTMLTVCPNSSAPAPLPTGGAFDIVQVLAYIDGFTHCHEFKGQDKMIFKGAAPFVNLPNLPLPRRYRYMEVVELVDQPDLDRAPGCKRGDLMTIGQLVQDGGTNITPAQVSMDHSFTCFMPTLSLVDGNLPITEENLYYSVNSNDEDWAQSNTPFRNVWAPMNGENLRHVELTTEMRDWLLDQELPKGELLSIQADQIGEPLVVASGQTFNFGKKRNRVPESIIHENARLAVNLEGRTNFQSQSDPLSDKPVFHVYTGANCPETAEIITVKNGGTLQLGDPNVSTKSGVLHALEGSTVIIESGGTLKVSNQSDLIIYAGATIILENGANVVLEDLESRVTINGNWQINGDFNFSGLGYFDFGGEVFFGPNATRFKLNGQLPFHRDLRLRADLRLPYHINLELNKGGVELNGSSIKVRGNAEIICKSVSFTGIGTGIDAKTTRNIELSSCRFSNISRPFSLSDLPGQNGGYPKNVKIQNSLFNNMENGGLISRRDEVSVLSCNYYNQDASTAVPEYVFFSDNNDIFVCRNTTINGDRLYEGPPVLYGLEPMNETAPMSEGIRVQGGFLCWMDGGSITNCDIAIGNRGVHLGSEATHQPANLLLTNKATLQNCLVGISMLGNQSDGTVIASCARFIDNNFSITGQDVTLLIDPTLINPSPLFTPLPNYFVRPGDFWGTNNNRYITLCFFEKAPGAALAATNNFWGVHDFSNYNFIVASTSGQLLTGFDVRKSAFAGCDGDFSTLSVATAPTSGPRDCDAALVECETLNGNGCIRDCEMAPDQLFGNTVRQQFMTGLDQIMREDWDGAKSRIQAVSDLWQPDLSDDGYTDDCVTFIRASRSLVDGAVAQRTPAVSKTFTTSNIQIMPNPATDHFIVQLPDSQFVVAIYDLLGKPLFRSETASDRYEISTETWPAGTYLVKATNAAGVSFSHWVVIQ